MLCAQSSPTLCDPVGFSRPEYWNGLPFPSLVDLPDPGIQPKSIVSPASAGRLFTTAPPCLGTGLCFLCSIPLLLTTRLCSNLSAQRRRFRVYIFPPRLLHWAGQNPAGIHESLNSYARNKYPASSFSVPHSSSPGSGHTGSFSGSA